MTKTKQLTTKCLNWVKHHRLAVIVTLVIVFYQVSRIIHAEMIGRHFELMVEPVIEVVLSRFIGGDE